MTNANNATKVSVTIAKPPPKRLATEMFNSISASFRYLIAQTECKFLLAMASLLRGLLRKLLNKCDQNARDRRCR